MSVLRFDSFFRKNSFAFGNQIWYNKGFGIINDSEDSI